MRGSAPPPGEVLKPSTVIGGCRIERAIGRGATAVVYEATDLTTERRVALKVLGPELSADPVFAERFRREGRLQAALEHPHVVSVYDAAESDYGLYIAMQLVRGPTLAELIHRGELSVARALFLLDQVADALDAAHGAGVIHRDVKPQNVLIDGSDVAYLADFGLTRLGRDAQLTLVGGIAGTLAYLAPEVIRGHTATPASDRYSFATMLFECLSGEVVFPRGTDAATLYAHTSEVPPAISTVRPEIPPELDPVLAGALAKDPAARPASAAELMEAAREALGAEAVQELGPALPRGRGGRASTIVPQPLGRTAGSAPARFSPPVRRALLVASGAMLGAAVTLVAVALLGRLHAPPKNPVPALAKGAIALGSALAGPGRPVDCRGMSPGPASPNCTLLQLELAGRRLIVPQAGVIRQWVLRDARGEFALQVLSERGGRIHQLARSQSVFVPDERPHTFSADLAVEQGNLIGIEPIAGATIGIRSPVKHAELDRWTGSVGGALTPVSSAQRLRGQELLLRLDLVPGGRPSAPPGVFGPSAAGLRAGRVIARQRFRYNSGMRAEVDLVQLGDRTVLDELRGGQRVARVEVPGPRPGGRVMTFLIDHSPAKLSEVGIYVEYANQDSQRLIQHYFLVHPFDFQYLN